MRGGSSSCSLKSAQFDASDFMCTCALTTLAGCARARTQMSAAALVDEYLASKASLATTVAARRSQRAAALKGKPAVSVKEEEKAPAPPAAHAKSPRRKRSAPTPRRPPLLIDPARAIANAAAVATAPAAAAVALPAEDDPNMPAPTQALRPYELIVSGLSTYQIIPNKAPGSGFGSIREQLEARRKQNRQSKE